MKRNYYHCYPTCPCCFAPNKAGSYLSIDQNELLRCTCNSVFHERFDLSEFEDTIKIVDKKGEYENNLKIPLLWEVNLNPLEEEYINWLKNCNSGNYLITWPWNNVKFIPIVISEYIIDNPDKKVMVIGNINHQNIFNENSVNYPDINLAFNSLLYLDKFENKISDFNLRTEKNHFKESTVFKLVKKFQCKVKFIGNNDFDRNLDREEYDASEFKNSIIKCKNDTKKWINEQYEYNVIKQVRWKKKGKEWSYEDKKNLNDKGFVSISIEEIEEYPTLRYSNTSLWDILVNIDHLNRVEKQLSSKTILSNTNLNLVKEDYNIFFVSDSIYPEYIFNLLKKIDPDLVIFQNIDNLIFHGRKECYEFFKTNQKTSLMFSTDPNKRDLLGINFIDGFTERNGVTVHTWDSSVIMNELFKVHKFKNDKFNPLSSIIKELPDYGEKPHVDYINVKSLDMLTEISSKILNVFSRSPQIKEYLDDLEKTPLIINGNPLEKEVFKRSNFNLNTIAGSLRKTDMEIYKEMINFFIEIYSVDREEQKNPIMEEISNLINNLDPNVTKIFLIVHPFDVKGTEKILESKEFNELTVCSWNDLDMKSAGLTGFFVISTVQPYRKYSLYSSKAKKFFFVGSKRNLNDIEKNVNYRLMEENIRPTHFLSEEENAPELLKKILEEIPNKEEILNVRSKILLEEKINIENNYDNPNSNEKAELHHRFIKAGEDVALAIDHDEKCMIIPFNRYLTFKTLNREGIEDLKVTKLNIDDFKNKEIIINERGIYTSSKSIFTRFMVNLNDNIEIKNTGLQWPNFKDLITDSTEWIRTLQHAVTICSKKNNISNDEAEKKIASYLATLDLNAKNKDYIKNWWSDPRFVSTIYGMIPIYEIEHPKGFYDLIKIYDGLNAIFPEMELSMENAKRSYIASKTLQNIRKSFLKDDKKYLNLEHQFQLLRKEIRQILHDSPRFEIKSVFKVKITKDTVPFKVMLKSEIDYL